jgi:hypothetical protein
MYKIACFCMALLINGACLATESKGEFVMTAINADDSDYSAESICNWMETKDSLKPSDNVVSQAKFPKRRWIRYDQKIHRWFFRVCKFGNN